MKQHLRRQLLAQVLSRQVSLTQQSICKILRQSPRKSQLQRHCGKDERVRVSRSIYYQKCFVRKLECKDLRGILSFHSRASKIMSLIRLYSHYYWTASSLEEKKLPMKRANSSITLYSKYSVILYFAFVQAICSCEICELIIQQMGKQTSDRKVSRLEQVKKGIKQAVSKKKSSSNAINIQTHQFIRNLYSQFFIQAIKKDTAPQPPVAAPTKSGDVDMKKKKSRPSSKKRRFLQLIKSNPKRDEKPKQLIDMHVHSVKKLYIQLLKEKGEEALSRGQKKRLKKKEKFINAKIMEGNAIETQKMLKERQLAMQRERMAASAKKDDAMMVDEQPKPIIAPVTKPMIGDFSGLSSILDSIQTQVAKKQEIAARQKSVKKIRAEEAQKEKERLQKIMNLNTFSTNPLDAIFQHVNNSIQTSAQHQSKAKF